MDPGAPQLLWLVVVAGERTARLRFEGVTPVVPGAANLRQQQLAKACAATAYVSTDLCSVAGIVAWAMAYGIGANGESGCLAEGCHAWPTRSGP